MKRNGFLVSLRAQRSNPHGRLPRPLRGLAMTIVLVLVLPLLFSCGAARHSKSKRHHKDVYLVPLDPKDTYQAGEWLRIAEAAVVILDYPTAELFSDRIMTYYPFTWYAERAEEIKQKLSNPKKNRRRIYRKNNPGLFFNG